MDKVSADDVAEKKQSFIRKIMRKLVDNDPRNGADLPEGLFELVTQDQTEF